MNPYGLTVGAFPHAPAPNSPYANMPFLGGDAFNGSIPHPSYPYSSAPPGLANRPIGMTPPSPPVGMVSAAPTYGAGSGGLGRPMLGTNSAANPYTGPGITPPFSWVGHGISNPMYQQGYRVGSDGRWYAPGTSAGPAGSYSLY